MNKNINRIIKIPRNEVSIFKSNNSNSTYGEITKKGVTQLLRQIPDRKYNKFCDLGSGIGIVIYYMIDLRDNFSNYIGVELSEERHKQSLILLNKKIRKCSSNISMVQGNILDIDLRDIDVIYISNLCFNHEFNKILSQKIDNEVKIGAIVFASQDIRITRDNIKTIFGVDQSWGDNTQMFKYEILGDLIVN